MDLLTEIKRLTAERGTLLARVRDIDTQLDAVRNALSPRAVVGAAIRAEVKPRRRRPPTVLGSTRESILKALTECEPQTARMLQIALADLQVTTVAGTLSMMASEGVLTTVKKTGEAKDGTLRPITWYARAGHSAMPSSDAEADDELGPPDTPNEGVDSTLSEMDSALLS